MTTTFLAPIAQPFIAHVYDHNLTFKKTMQLINRPILSMVVNSTGQNITLELPAANTQAPLIVQGDIIKLTEQNQGGFPGITDGFEILDPADATMAYGWSRQNTQGTGTSVVAANNAHSGSNSLQLTNPSNGNYGAAFRKQGFQVPFNGGTVNLSVWAKGSVAGTTGTMRVTFTNPGTIVDDTGFANAQPSGQLDSNVQQVSGLAVTTSYQQITASVTIPAGYTWGFVEFYNNGTNTVPTLYIDDVAYSIVANDPGVLYTGIVEDLPDTIDQETVHQITLAPLGVEVGETDFSNNYTSATDVSQMIRDAVARCAHCTATTGTVPNSGKTGIFNFNETNVLTVLQTAAKIAGANYIWFIDEIGQVWFGPTSGAAVYSIKTRTDAPVRKYTAPITTLKNFVQGFGAVIPNTDGTRVAATFDQTAGSPYGRRALIPPLHFPNLTDQSTLQSIVNTVGAALNQIQVSVEFELPNFGQRINLAQVGGAAVRYFEPTIDVFPETDPGAGAYSVAYVIMQVDVDGPIQRITARGIAMNVDDFVNEINDTMNRVANDTVPALYPITPGQVSGATQGGASIPATPAWDFPHWNTGIDNISQTNNAYIIIRWSPNTTSDNVSHYEIRYSKNADGNYYRGFTASPAALDGNGDAYLKIAGLIQGTSYTFEVRAINNLGVASNWSSTQAQVAATDSTAPAVPTGLTAIKTPRGALVSWNGNTEADLQGYEVQVSVGGGAFSLVTPGPTLGTTLAYTAPSGTALGTSLQFQIRAVDWSGNFSAYSASSTAVNTDGIVFDELLVGNLKVFGTITTGGFQTAASGARVVIDSTSIRIYDGTGTNYGAPSGAGVTCELKNDGTAFFKGTITASNIYASTMATSSTIGNIGAGAGFKLSGNFLDLYSVGTTAEGVRFWFAPDNVTAFSSIGQVAAAQTQFPGPVTTTVLQLTNFSGGFEVVTSDTALGRGISQTHYSGDTNTAIFHGRKARGTQGSPTTVLSGDGSYALIGEEYDGTNWVWNSLIGSGNPTGGTVAAGAIPADWLILLGQSQATLTEMFRVTHNGHWWANGGTAPTLGAIKAGISSQSIAGNDVVMNVNTVSNAAKPNGQDIATVNYGTAWGSIPKHASMQASPQVSASPSYYIGGESVSNFTFTAFDPLVNTEVSNFNWINIGSS